MQITQPVIEPLDLNEVRISAVRSVRVKTPETITLSKAFATIRSDKYAPAISAIRSAFQAGNMTEGNKLKKRLPAFMFSGTFSKRKSDAIQEHSGLLVLDFDKVDIGQKATIALDPYAVMTFISPSGHGLKCVIRIEAATTAEQHAESLESARAYFKERYGLEADETGKDLARLCYVSYDPEAVLNEKAVVLHRGHRAHSLYSPYKSIHDNASEGEKDAPKNGVAVNRQIDDIISATLPTQSGQRHKMVFALCRGLKFDCGLAEKPLQELKPIVRAWHSRALPNIWTKEFDETWSDFIQAWKCVKKPLAETAVSSAWEKVNHGGLPLIAGEYETPKVKSLIGLCWQLSIIGEGTFYLSMHDAANLLGVHPQQVQRWLKMLCVDDVLSLETKGTIKTASTYKWIEAKQTTKEPEP